MHIGESKRIAREEMAEQEVQRWATVLSDFTMHTAMFPLTKLCATAMVKIYQRDNLGHKKDLNMEEMESIQDLEKRIENMLSQFQENGGFIRLSTRSPKDAPLFTKNGRNKLVQSLTRRFQKIYPDYVSEQSIKYNDEFRAFNEEWMKTLKISAASEAMELLLSSERVLTDLLMALDFPEIWTVQVVLREWNPTLSFHFEFRGFVFGGKMTALSQYDPSTYFRELATESGKVDISNKITSFFMNNCAEKMSNIGVQNYVVDFAFCGEGDSAEVVVVEINAWGRGTGSACFNWDTDSDILMGKTSDTTVFRVVEDENPTNSWERSVAPEWIEIMDEAREMANQARKNTKESRLSCTQM